MRPKIDPKLLANPLFRELVAEGLAMQDRFAAEPVYSKTGKGHLKKRRRQRAPAAQESAAACGQVESSRRGTH